MVQLSIIIVNYHVKKELIDCIESIYKSRAKISYEIIVVDNDEIKTIGSILKKSFPQVKYITNKNKGFGQGNNIGAKHAKGKYLLFLNPDTKIYLQSLERLVEFYEKETDTGIVAPLLLDPDEKPYSLQGTKSLTPISGAIVLSFINKIFPNNPISRNYWQTGWDKTKKKEVDVVPGTAFLIAKKLYNEIGGFDEHFFLYFEEFDLCKRVRDKGYKIFIIPTAKVMHLWARSTSTQPEKKINKIFITSRKYYFRKHYGLLNSWFVELFATFGKQKLFLLLIILLGFFLRVYKLDELMPFIGDHAWFYLSARDMIISQNIPLLGITSSHTWIHQGPLWTYMLAPVLWLANWNPLAGGYLSVILGTITIWMMYKVGKELFTEKTGIISALLFATSPLIILHARMPYHTSPIPLFTLLFMYSLYKWLKGNSYSLPWVFFFLAILYNFELATSILWFTFIPILIFKLLNSTKKLKTNIIVLSITAFTLPMLPMLIYDVQNGFPQTVRFVLWIGYKILTLLGMFPNTQTQTFNVAEFLSFTATKYQQLIFLPNGPIAGIFLTITTTIFYGVVYSRIKHKKYETNWIMIAILFTISILGYLAGKTTSDAYLPILFPSIILVNAISLQKLSETLHFPKKIFLIVIVLISASNIFSLVSQNYLVPKNKPAGLLKEKLAASKKIIVLTDGHPYNLKGKGSASEFKSFTMNYEYLTWWLGHKPSSKHEKLKIIIQENDRGILLTKED